MKPINSFKFDLKFESANLISDDKEKPFFYRVEVDENYKLALCTENIETINLIHVSPKIILNKICK